MHGSMRVALAMCLAWIAGCASTAPPAPPPGALQSPGARERAARLGDTIERIAGRHWNPGRLFEARELAAEAGLADLARSERIDWFTVQSNYLIEIPGQGDGIAYLVAHYDKTDSNPLKFASLMVNGLIDELVGFSYLSQGAWDDATGVAAVLELARSLSESEPRLTWRILLAGAEESGLRGSRAHVARLSDDEWSRLRFAINVDSIAKDDRDGCVMLNASDPGLAGEAVHVARTTGLPLRPGRLPSSASGDHVPFASTSFGWDLLRGLQFNLVGGLLPQRSWFTGSHGTRVLTFASCDVVDWTDFVGSALMLPTGRLHGPRDRASRVDLVKLERQVELLEALVQRLDSAP